jgi:hypothetical protein
MAIRPRMQPHRPALSRTPLGMTSVCVILTLGLIFSPSPASAQETIEQLLQEAVYREQIEGDLQGAINLYEQIIGQVPKSDSLLVCAKLRLAMCYEKKGEERALGVYRDIIRDYPNQSDALRIARSRLAVLSERAPDFSALVDQYIARVGIERLGTVSPDGTLEAHTDWTTGNLIVKNRKTGKITELTHKTWDQSPEFAYYKAWSPDGQRIAYGWYRDGSCIGLRVISVDGGDPEIILEREGTLVFPADWSRDGKQILARMAPAGQGAMKDSLTLSLISIPGGACTPLILVDGDSRGLQFSPDGRFVVFDRLGEDERTREVYTLSISDRRLTKLSGEVIGEKDTPVWSPGGRRVLFCAKASGGTLLMAVPVQEGMPTGKPYLLHMNIQSEIQRRAGIERQQLVAAMEKLEQASLLTDMPALDAFEDNFDSTRLDPSWKVVQWEGPNVYGFKTFGRISLTDSPGHLRYYLDPMALWMLPLSRTIFGDGSGYWYYPALQLRRRLAGTSWVLETKATYGLVRPADGRYFFLGILFVHDATVTGFASIERLLAWGNRPIFGLSLSTPGTTFNRISSFSPPGDTLGPLPYTCCIRISRRDTVLNVEMSEDGVSYIHAASASYPREALGNEQQLLIMGGGWFTPAGAFVDFDYFRFHPLLKAVRK